MNWIGTVDQTRNRFFVLVISFLVLIISLAGLMGIIDILPQYVDSGSSSNGDSPASSQPGPSGIDKKSGGTSPGPITDELTAGISSVFSLKVPPPPHIPLFEITGAATTSLLRSKTSSSYDGERWLREDKSQPQRYEGETLPVLMASYNQKTEDDIEVIALFTPPAGTVLIPTSLYPLHVSADIPLLYFPEEQVFHSEEGFPDAYVFRTAHYYFDDSLLLKAEVDSQNKYLRLPSAITERTGELARTITRGITSPYQKAKAIEDYLKTNYAYDFDYKYAPDGWEPNDWFLFEDKRGVCGNFNSAFIILGRAVGIPARLVGGFRVTPQEEKQVVYQDQAHAWAEVKFKDLGWYTFDATASLPNLLPTVTEITSVEPIIKKGYSLNIQGTVKDTSGNPADGQWVEVFINSQKETEGGLLIGEGATNSEGSFEIKAIIPPEMDVGDYHVLAHSLESIRYMESWGDPVIKVVTATNLSMQVPSRVKIQELVTLEGNLNEEFGEPVTGQPISVYLADIKVAELTTNENGQFAWEQGFDKAGAYILKTDFTGTDYYLKSSREAEFEVLIPTKINLDVLNPDTETEATVQEPILITGSLFEELTRIPLSNHEIQVLIDGEPVGDSLITDKEGSFQVEYTFEETGNYQVEAKFSSVPFYWESSTGINLDIFPVSGVSLWPYLITVPALLLAGIGGFFIYRWQRRRQLLAALATPALSAAQAVPLPQREVPRHAISLTIEFPQINSPFPDVWGLGEALEIVCHLTSSQGEWLADKQLEIYINGELVPRLITDKNGEGKLDYIFNDKGQHELMVRGKEEDSGMDVSARRTVRIVDYREEIVNLFEALVNSLRDLGIELDMKLTPREIEDQVSNAGQGIPERAMDKVVSCFEEADYSLHSINRSHYQDIYVAQREIREHGGEFTGEPAREP